MLQRDLDLLMGIAFFLVGALFAVLAKVYLLEPEPEPVRVWMFGPGTSEPERAACEARRRKLAEEAGELGDPADDIE